MKRLMSTAGICVLAFTSAVGCSKGFQSATEAALSDLGSTSNPPPATQQNVQTIEVAASDNVGVTKVEVFIDGTLKCTLTSAPYRCNWPVEGSEGQEVTLTAKAYDAKGNVGNSAPVKVTLR